MFDHLTLLVFVRLDTLLRQAITADHGTAGASVPAGPPRARLGIHDDRGQATTEYALVLLAAALVGLMVVAWASAGGGAARISRLFNSVIDAVVDKI